MKLRLLPLLIVPLFAPASAEAAWQTGAQYKTGLTEICAVPKGELIVIRFRVDARAIRRTDGYGNEAQGGVFRVRAGKTVYAYDKRVVVARGHLSEIRRISVARTARIEPWIGNQVNPLDQRRVAAAQVVRC